MTLCVNLIARTYYVTSSKTYIIMRPQSHSRRRDSQNGGEEEVRGEYLRDFEVFRQLGELLAEIRAIFPNIFAESAEIILLFLQRQFWSEFKSQ